MLHSLSEQQVQTLLQYLYSEHAETRCEAIRYTVENGWRDEQVLQALGELAALDRVREVREAAREALGVMSLVQS